MTCRNFFTGMGVGIVIGSAVGMAVAPGKKKNKNLVGRAIKTVGEVVEDISDAINW